MGRYVLVHGAWHTGKELEPVADTIRAAGHTVHTPTIKGNRPGDPKSVGLEEAIESIVEYINENHLRDTVLLGHSYGGMIITGVADRVPDSIRRLASNLKQTEPVLQVADTQGHAASARRLRQPATIVQRERSIATYWGKPELIHSMRGAGLSGSLPWI